MPTVQEQYEKYLCDKDKKIQINGNVYYKAVCIDQFELTGIGRVISLVLPLQMFDSSSYAITIENEAGRMFKITGPEFLRFSYDIPKWYYMCGSFWIEDSDCPLDEVGHYFRVSHESAPIH